MGVKDPNRRSARGEKIRGALAVLEDMEKYRNVHRGAAVFFFFASAGFGISVFFFLYDFIFLLNELTFRAKISEFVASGIISLSWVMIFPVWILAFLFIFSGLDAMGLRDLRVVAGNRLSNLQLGPDELHELRDNLASRNWKHGRIVESVVADLIEKQSDSIRSSGSTAANFGIGEENS